jgi:uncharacterized protein
MTTFNFDPISPVANLSRFQAFKDRLLTCLEITSDYSFANLWGWADEYDLAWAWQDELVWIKQQQPISVYWAPVGQWADIDWPLLLKKRFPKGAVFIRIPEKLAALWENTLDNHVQIDEARGQWDYLYSTAELTELKGNRFHKKKNLVNQFLKKYNYTYVPMGPELVKDALAMQTDWCLWKDCESSEALTSENQAIEKILTQWSSFENLLGGGILSDEKLIAYTVAEPLSKDMLVIHFEKGNQEYKGVYQAINQLFLATVADKYHTVNREQDLDDPGLRKAKLSYQPIGFQKKYEVKYWP